MTNRQQRPRAPARQKQRRAPAPAARDPETIQHSPETAEKRLEGFIARYSPEVAALAREVRAKMRARLPGAIELVYDNYNALAIGFSPTERTSDAIFSIALWPRWVSLFFLQGAGLPDPHRLLQGKGKVARHLVLEDAALLDDPRIEELIAEALKKARTPLDSTGAGRLVIKSVSAKQRPRRPD